MASINSFNSTEPLIDALAVDDIGLIYDTSTGRTKTANANQLQSDVVTTSSSTGTLTMLGTGTTVLSATATATWELAAPLYSGQTKYIVQTTTATAVKVVHASTSVATSFIDSTKTGLTFLNQGSAVILKGISTTQWAVMANVGTVGST